MEKHMSRIEEQVEKLLSSASASALERGINVPATRAAILVLTERAEQLHKGACRSLECHLSAQVNWASLALAGSTTSTGAVQLFAEHAVVEIDKLNKENETLRARLEDLSKETLRLMEARDAVGDKNSGQEQT
jgi:hypothetical protein